MTRVISKPAAEEPSADVAAAERMSDLVELRHFKLIPWPGLNPRKRFSEERIRELAASVSDHGVLQNLVVHDTGEDVKWIVAGETRWRGVALAEAGCPEIMLDPAGPIMIPCRLRKFTEGQALALAMLENIQRQTLTAIEEAEGFSRLIALNDWTQAKCAEEILGDARRQSYVAHRLRLLELPVDVRGLIEDGHIHASQARDYLLPLTRLEDDLPAKAFGRVLEAVQGILALGGRIEGAWLELAAERAREDIELEFGSKDLFGGTTSVPAPELQTPSSVLIPMCSVCGCTEEQACDSGCAWVHSPGEAPLCSNPSCLDAFAKDLRDARDRLVADALAPNETAERGWAGIAESGVDDAVLLANVEVRLAGRAGASVEVEPSGRYIIVQVEPPVIVVELRGRPQVTLEGDSLVEAVRRVFCIPTQAGADSPAGTRQYATWELERGYDGGGQLIPDDIMEAYRARLAARPVAVEPAGTAAPEPVEVQREPAEDPVPTGDLKDEPAHAVSASTEPRKQTPSSASKPPSAPAAPASPEPGPTAAPLSVLAAPGTPREALSGGEGLILAVLTATGGRPGVISYTPLPGGRVTVTVAPRILKAGERPFALVAAAAELDGLLVEAIDTHFIF